MDVAGQHRDRGGPPAPLVSGDAGQEVSKPSEGPAERSPVLEVEGLAEPLARPNGPATQPPRGDLLIPRLEAVNRRREEPGQRGPDHQVVDVRREALLDPCPLVVVHHRPATLLEDPAVAGV